MNVPFNDCCYVKKTKLVQCASSCQFYGRKNQFKHGMPNFILLNNLKTYIEGKCCTASRNNGHAERTQNMSRGHSQHEECVGG